MKRTSTIQKRARDAREWAEIFRRRLSDDEHARQYAGFTLLNRARRSLLPEYRLTEYMKLWFEDEGFIREYRRFEDSDRSADRKFFIRELLKLVDELPGDTAEAGVYSGATSWFICEARTGQGGTHWAFDSFEGLSAPAGADGRYWTEGDLAVAEGPVRELLEPYGARVIKGWIPEVFDQAEMEPLVFVHIDVDLYEPTLASLEFFYPRMATGGVLVCDDYGFATCPGATRAIHEFMDGRPEPVLHCPTGQGIIIKR
jgi:O-methyltransferase